MLKKPASAYCHYVHWDCDRQLNDLFFAKCTVFRK